MIRKHTFWIDGPVNEEMVEKCRAFFAKLKSGEITFVAGADYQYAEQEASFDAEIVLFRDIVNDEPAKYLEAGRLDADDVRKMREVEKPTWGDHALYWCIVLFGVYVMLTSTIGSVVLLARVFGGPL